MEILLIRWKISSASILTLLSRTGLSVAFFLNNCLSLSLQEAGAIRGMRSNRCDRTLCRRCECAEGSEWCRVSLSTRNDCYFGEGFASFRPAVTSANGCSNGKERQRRTHGHTSGTVTADLVQVSASLLDQEERGAKGVADS